MPTLYTSLLARHEGFAPKPDLEPKAPIVKSVLDQGIRHIQGSGIARRKACRTASEQAKKRPKARGLRTVDVVVIGAGLAGLSAAYELSRAGYSVEVVEARHEVGGRTRTAERIAGKHAMDKGAELIGANHPLWLHYRSQFKLHLTPVKEYGNSPIRFHGRTLSWDETDKLNKGLTRLLKKLNGAAERILDPYEPWMNPDAKKLDKQSLEEWANKATKDKRYRHALLEMMETDGGVSADKQSLLGVLAMIKGGGLNRFWKDTELYRCKGGTQSLASAFEKQLEKLGVKIHKCVQVRHIHIAETHARLETTRLKRTGKDKETKPALAKDRKRGPTFVSEFVILAIPPTAWRTISRVNPPALRQLLHGGRRPQMGKNTKFLMGLDARFWKDAALSPNLTEDGPVDLTWETTEALKTGKIGMVAFSGAGDAKTLSKLQQKGSKRVKDLVLKKLQPVYQPIKNHVRKCEFVNWPKDPWTRASYCFPKPGEPGDVTYWGPIYKAGFRNRLFFAGEHTSWAFMGYMEGALSSGYRVATRIALRDTLGIG